MARRRSDRSDRTDRRRSDHRDQRRRECRFCARPGREVIDYKNLNLLEQFVDEEGQIRKARRARACRRHQSIIAHAIKRSREIALMPYVRV